MNGKEKCQLLKSICKKTAERYGLTYIPTECTYDDNCQDSCHRCEAELKDLQQQLTEKGIEHIDLEKEIHQQLEGLAPEYDTKNKDGLILERKPVLHNGKKNPLEETNLSSDTEIITMSTPPCQTACRKRKVFFKECAIAGWRFHNPEDWWNELDEGMELALVREKKNRYDRNAVAIAFPCDYDGNANHFDFDYIIGYVPRTENEMIAKMMDMGWQDVFTAELSTLKDKGSLDSRLRISIYIQSKDESEEEKHCYAQYIDEGGLKYITCELQEKGYVIFRWGGFPPWELDLPEEGDEVFFVYKTSQEAILYRMKTITCGKDSAFFTGIPRDEPEMPDDCATYVLTNIHGPLPCSQEQLEFLKDYSLSEAQPEGKLPSDISDNFKKLFITELIS